MPEAQTEDVRRSSGIKYLGATDSFGVCIVKFWVKGQGWEYSVEKAWLNSIQSMADKGPGIALNFCKNHSTDTYGPYDKDWRLIDADAE